MAERLRKAGVRPEEVSHFPTQCLFCFFAEDVDLLLPGSTHPCKYRLAFVVRGECLVRVDNGAGKGDHRHLRGREAAYRFTGLDRRFADFEREARRLLNEDRDP